MFKLFRLTLILLITAALFTAYYVWHPPLTRPAAMAVGGALLDIFTALALFAVAGGLGRGLLRPAPMGTLSKAERVGIEGLIGFGVLSLVGLGAGLLGVFTPRFLWGLLAVLAAVTVPFLLGYLGTVAGLLRRAFPRTGWTRFLAGLCMFWLGTSLIIALMPPTSWDALMYHLVLPKRLLATGQLTAYPDNHYLGFPQATEMLFAWAMGLFGRDTVAALMHYGVGVLGLSVVCGLTGRFISQRASWLAAAFLLSGGGFWLALTQEYVDLALFALSAGVLSALTAWRHEGNWRWLVVMGVLIGFAVSAKYTAALIAVATVVALLVSAPRRIVQNGLIVGGVALLVYLPWALRGYAQYGNPFYPYIFGGINWSAERSAFFGGVGGGLLDIGPLGWVQIPLLPFISTVVGMEGRVRYSYDSGLWLMPLAALVLIGWRYLRDDERRLAANAGLLLLPMLIMWIITGSLSGIGAHARRVITVFPAFAVLSVIAFEALPRWAQRPINLAVIIRGLVAVSLVINAVSTLTAFLRYNPAWMLTLPPVAENAPPDATAQIITQGREAYILNRVGGHYIALQALGEQLPDGARVRLLFEPKAYYCPASVICDPDTLTDHWSHALAVDGLTPDEVMAQWRDEVDAVLLWKAGYTFYTEIEPYQAEENRQLPAALDEHMRLLWTDDFGSYALYVWAD